MADSEFENNPEGLDFKSKTQLKNESQELYKLGQTLVGLGPANLAKIPLDEELAESIALAQRINKKKDGYRRQLQFLGKLLRARETADIERALFEIQSAHLKSNQKFHQLETTRDHLLEKGDEAINVLLNEHSQLDRQKLRQLVRQANKQKEQNKPPKAAREIFQYLKENIQS